MILERVTTVLVEIDRHGTKNLEKTRALAQIRKHNLLSHGSCGETVYITPLQRTSTKQNFDETKMAPSDKTLRDSQG